MSARAASGQVLRQCASKLAQVHTAAAGSNSPPGTTALAPLEQTLLGMVVVGVCARLADKGMTLEAATLAGVAMLSSTKMVASHSLCVGTERLR